MHATQKISRQRPEVSSGIITIDHKKVTWHNEDLVFASFDLQDVVIIGETTNSNGPWFDDWFLTFVMKDGSWINISWYAENIEELTKILSEIFKSDFTKSCLINSTSWNSIVSHPSHLKGDALFVLVPSKNNKAPKSFFDKLLHLIGFGNFSTAKDTHLTDKVKKELIATSL